ncbi:hypothetical protein EDD15DRAFT_2212399 [Pisolithus albus]|nr:hypothetical protein EDD15DRAFT_2330738 [Pisolithus albus]KAI6005561.1 hypothetical protein EDD15DRAFT_2212399 [Pisolithus albus]
MASISSRRLSMELGEINLEGCPAEVLGESLYQVCIYTFLILSYLSTFWVCATRERFSTAGRFVVDQTAEAPILPHIYSNGHVSVCYLSSESIPIFEHV